MKQKLLNSFFFLKSNRKCQKILSDGSKIRNQKKIAYPKFLWVWFLLLFVTFSSNLQAQISVEPTTFCQGTSPNVKIRVKITGGTSPYTITYKIGNGSNITKSSYINDSEITMPAPSVTTTYTLVSVTDKFGTLAMSGSAVLTQVSRPAIPTITADGPTTFCQGESVNLTSAPGTSYRWTIPGGTILTTQSINVTKGGNYTVQVTNANGCMSISSLIRTITVNPLPTIPKIEAITHPSCLKSTGSIVLSGLPAIGTWTINPGSFSGSGTSAVIPNLNPGDYDFTVTNNNGCISPLSRVTINAQSTTTPSPILVNNITLGCNQTSYIQEWQAIADATGYELDVATDPNFTNFLSGYQNKELGNVSSETITGLASGIIYYVRLRAISNCGTSLNSSTVTINPLQSTTYNVGGWSNGTPDSNKSVIFNSNFIISTPMNACSCQVNAGINVIVQSDLKLENGLTVDPTGNLTFENNASLVQVNDVPNSGKIIYKRNTAPMVNFDYTYWSSPVFSQKLYDLSPNTLGDKYHSWGPNGWVTHFNGTAVMEPGIGYIIRTPKAGTWPNSEVVTFPYSQPVAFVGTPNNGNILAEVVPGGKFHLVGNPYPSALDADEFLETNSNILDGTVFLWTHNTPAPIGNQLIYTSDDYAAYNGIGGIATRKSLSNGINSSIPTGKIAAGQSFFIASIAAGQIKFNNAMRSSGSNNQFFKQTKSNKTTVEKHRFWLDLTNSQGAFKQILIGYATGATNGYDTRFDGSVFSANSFINFYSKTQTTNLAIQGRALPLEDTDSIELGYSSTIDGVFSINVSNADGQFTNKAIYLEDKVTNTYFNLKNGAYDFNTLKGTFDNRFVIHYIPNVIQVPVLSEVPELSCNQTSFVFNWTAIANASTYKYDIATDEQFNNILPDYQDKEVSGYNSEEITGLTGVKYYIRLRAMYNSVASTNSNVITVSKPITVYNGNWSNGLPDSSKNVIFDNVSYTLSGDMSACSCQINANANITVPGGITLKLENGLTVQQNGSLTFENNASLVQVNEAVNTGKIIYKRITSPMKNFDFTYWSSPVVGQVLNVLSPNTLSDKYFSFDNNNWVTENGNNAMAAARGYIIRTPKAGVWGNGENVVFPYSQPVQFIGTPNNGHQEFIINTAGLSNLIGNPYASSLDADLFIEANINVLAGTMHFWTHNTAITNNVYSSDDYASYNVLGGIATLANSAKPSGKIAAGQSFFIANIEAGVVSFENDMRLSGQNSQFFKPGKNAKTTTVEKHRYWLNLTNPQGAFKQILIGNITGATNDYDNHFDGERWDGNSFVNFYSISSGINLSIQSRALPFDNYDTVSLGYKSTIDGNFAITIDEVDGLFTDQNIYLEDLMTNSYHNLKNSPYNFTTPVGTFNDRFVIHYVSNNTNKQVTKGYSDSNGSENQVIVSAENNQINIHSFEEIIDKVFVYDLNGKQIYEKGQINKNEFFTPSLILNNQVLVVKVTLQNGKTVVKKAVF